MVLCMFLWRRCRVSLGAGVSALKPCGGDPQRFWRRVWLGAVLIVVQPAVVLSQAEREAAGGGRVMDDFFQELRGGLLVDQEAV